MLKRQEMPRNARFRAQQHSYDMVRGQTALSKFDAEMKVTVLVCSSCIGDEPSGTEMKKRSGIRECLLQHRVRRGVEQPRHGRHQMEISDATVRSPYWVARPCWCCEPCSSDSTILCIHTPYIQPASLRSATTTFPNSPKAS